MKDKNSSFCPDSCQNVKESHGKKGGNTSRKVTCSSLLTLKSHPYLSSHSTAYKCQVGSGDDSAKDADSETDRDCDEDDAQNREFVVKMEPEFEHYQDREKASWQHHLHSSLPWTCFPSVPLNLGKNHMQKLDHGKEDTKKHDQSRQKLDGNSLDHCGNCSSQDGSSSERDQNPLVHREKLVQLCGHDTSQSSGLARNLSNKSNSSWHGVNRSSEGFPYSVRAGKEKARMYLPSEKAADNHDEDDDDLFHPPVHFSSHDQESTNDQHSPSSEEEEEKEMEEEDDLPVGENYGTAPFATPPFRSKLKGNATYKKTGIKDITSTTSQSLPKSSMKVTTPEASPIEQLHECLYCDATFMDANNLKRHLSYIHPDRPVEEENRRKGHARCEECGKTFDRPSRLKRHKLTHTGEKPFVCEVCNKTFSQASNLKTHQMLHTGSKSFVCDVCHKAFRDASYLKKHQVIHTGDKPFVCDICDKAFVETGHLKRHRKIHTGDKPYVCDVCGKAFTEAGTLRRHKVLTNHNPIICTICNRTFLLPEHLAEHHKVHAPSGDAASEEKMSAKP